MVQQIASSTLPSQPFPDRGGAILARINTGTPSSGARLAKIDRTPIHPQLATSGTVSTTIATGTATITIPTGTVPTAIAAPNIAPYTPALDTSNPQPGEYVQSGSTVVITLRTGEKPGAVTYFGLSGTYPKKPTEYVPAPYPDLYSQLQAIGAINVKGIIGNVAYKRSFEGHPSTSINFYSYTANKEAVIAQFRNRTQALFYAMGYELGDVKIKELPITEFPQGIIDVTISFVGRHQYLMAQPVKQRGGNITSRLAQYIPITDIATRAGLTVVGTNQAFFTPSNTPHNATTTVAAALQSYIRLDNGFQFLSRPDAIEVRTFGQTTQHWLAEADILSEPETGLPGKEIIYQNRQLVKIYKNTLLSFDFSGLQSGQGRRTYYDPLDDPSIPPDDITQLRESGLAFDNGGRTKEQSFITAISNTELARSTITYGFAFCLKDVYLTASAYDVSVNPATYWIPVKSTTTTFTYNQYGYLTSVVETGTRTARLKQEQNGETLTLTSTAEIDAYRFNLISPSEKTTTYELARFGAVFADTSIDVDVPPYFCLREDTLESSATIAPDPKSTPGSPLPAITTGKLMRQVKTINITSNIPGKEAYDYTITTQNQEGTGFKQAAKQSNTEKKLGKPAPHTWADTDTEIFSVNLRATGENLASQQYKYLLNIQGSSYGDLGAPFAQYGSYAALNPQQGSESYPTYVLERGIRAAECDLAITNSQGSETLNLTVRRNLAYQEGDLLWRKGQLFVIFDISWTEKVSPGRADCDGMQLSLGRYLRVPITVLKVPLQA